jgi:predicted nucleotidyltransferase/DNA-binding transcriptional ArsR family regulator
MASVFASEITPEIAVALATNRSLGVREMARILGRSPSSVQRALPPLAEGGLVARAEDGDYTLSSRSGEMLGALSLEMLPAARVIELAARASPAIEFAGVDSGGALLVTRWSAEIDDIARLEAVLESLRNRGPDSVHFYVADGDQVRDRLLEDSALRRRALRSRVLKGSVDRTFPDPARHGDPSTPALDGLNPSLGRPPAASLRRIATRFGLRRIVVFGSAVRADLRPDSDIDVLVEPELNSILDLDGYLGVREALESLFDRRVDLVEPGTLRPKILAQARAQGVTIYERTRPRGTASAA